MENTNPSSGHIDKESYDCFVAEYEQFVENCRAEGCNSSASRIGNRSPLQLALMISPLYLFMTARLSMKSYNRRTLIDLAAKLGPKKPPLILKVENLIWDALFKLAEGRSLVYDILLELANSLPWMEINGALNPGTEAWFDLSSSMLSFFLNLKGVHYSTSYYTAIRTTSTIENVVAAPENDSSMNDVSSSSGEALCMFF